MVQDGRLIKTESLEQLRETIIGLFAEGEYHEVGMREICRRAKVSPQTVYKYFGSKDRLLLACMEMHLQRLAAHCQQAAEQQPDALGALQHYSLAAFEFYAREPLIARIIYLNIPDIYWANRSSPAREALAEQLGLLIDQAQAEGVITPEIPRQWIVDILTGAANRLLTRWLVEGGGRDIAAEAERYLDAVFHGLIPS